MPRRRQVVSSDDEEFDEPSPKRRQSTEDDDEYDDKNTSGYRNQKATRYDELATLFVRTLIGIENKYQIINRRVIDKILEAEESKNMGLKFKRDLLPRVRMQLGDVFGMDLVALPMTADHKVEEYILVNVLPETLKATTYRFLRSYTADVSTLEDLTAHIESHGDLLKYSGTLAKPGTEYIQRGFKMLVLSIVALHSNNISRKDLGTVLDDQFHLQFKETKQVDIFGNQTFGQFIQGMEKQGYLQVQVQEATKKNAGRQGRRPVVQDDKLRIYGLGRRALAEFTQESFIDFFKEVYGEWSDSLQQSAERTLKAIWGKEEEEAV